MKFKQLYIICLVILCLTGQDASSLSLSSSPLSILKIRNEIYTVKDNNAKSSGQILSLSIIFDQQIYYRHAGCGGTPKPVGSLNFGRWPGPCAHLWFVSVGALMLLVSESKARVCVSGPWCLRSGFKGPRIAPPPAS